MSVFNHVLFSLLLVILAIFFIFQSETPKLWLQTLWQGCYLLTAGFCWSGIGHFIEESTIINIYWFFLCPGQFPLRENPCPQPWGLRYKPKYLQWVLLLIDNLFLQFLSFGFQHLSLSSVLCFESRDSLFSLTRWQMAKLPKVEKNCFAVPLWFKGQLHPIKSSANFSVLKQHSIYVLSDSSDSCVFWTSKSWDFSRIMRYAFSNLLASVPLSP